MKKAIFMSVFNGSTNHCIFGDESVLVLNNFMLSAKLD